MDTASSSYGLILAVLWLAIAFYRRGIEGTEKKKNVDALRLVVRHHILAFRNSLVLHCSQYETSLQLQRDSSNEVVPNTCCAKATNVNEE
ncbi:MAG: hypothetical protein ACYTXT_12440 [Nostoc sp.]|uniref:hypothetical protein n=1 Tax=Nostoc sp. TaxID=1180 RepID=UPI002FF2A935